MADRSASRPDPSPPAASRALLGWVARARLPAAAGEALLGDLEEEFSRRVAADVGAACAARRYRREALRSAGALLLRPSQRSRTTSRPGDSLMQAFFDDLRLAGRNLLRAPGFSLVVVMTLALGLGSVTAVYTLIDGVVLRPLPFDDPDSLVRLFGFDSDTNAGQWSSSYPDFADFRQRSESFSTLAAANAFPTNVAGHAERPARITVGHVTHDLFDLLGTRVVIGRELEPEDDRQGAEPVAVISESFWRRHFAGQAEDTSVLGRRLTINAVAHTVVGVVERPHFPAAAEIFTALATQPSTEVRGVHNIQPVGRLAPGVSIESANAELATIAARLGEEYPEDNLTRGARVVPLQEALVGRLRQPFSLLLGAAAFVLLIVCANVSNLLLHRAARRGREVATRSALGASAAQLLRQFFAESLWLVSFGGALGFVFAWLGKEVQLQRIPTTLPRAEEVALDERILLFGFALTALVALVFTLVPVLEVTRRDLFAALGAGTRHQGGSKARGRLRQGLVVVEIALAVILVVGAGLMIRTMRQLADVDPGCDPERVLAMPLALRTQFISPQWPQSLEFFDRLKERISAMPGVVAATVAYQDPSDPGWTSSFTIEGEPPPDPGREPEAAWRPVGPDYFRAMGIPLLRGRSFLATDDAEAAGAVIVNQAFVDQHLAEEPEPLGRVINKRSWWIEDVQQLRIVGVVGDVKFSGRHLSAQPALYLPHRQFPVPQMKVLVRTAGEPLAISQALRQAVWDIDPELPIDAVATLEEKMAGTFSYRRFLTQLLSFFGASALFLAALGLYGVLAYSMAQRTREIGLRVAIGAQKHDVLGLVMGQGLRLTAVGLALGFAGAWGTTRWLQSILFGIRRGDPQTLAMVAVAILLVTLLATWIPARRALSVEPTRALQEE